MRTTVEIRDEQRARLLELAARRGKKGFSELIQEALDLYLREQGNRQAVDRALTARGALADKEADELERSVAAVRERWR